jgi:short subunit dehydrogenase-like uncharacterized protein
MSNRDPLRNELPWMVYGAYGVTGRLIVEEALRRGHRPVLAGRDAARLQPMAQSLGLESVAVSLADAHGLRGALTKARMVVHAVGPYVETGEPMLQACLATQTPYVDIAGELGQLKAVDALGDRARLAGVPLLTGAGFGVTYGDCLARHVVDRLPDATHLQLSIAADNFTTSPAVRRTILSVFANGGMAIEGDQSVRRPLAHQLWTVTHEGQPLDFAAAPLGELQAAAMSTGVANIVAGRPMSHRAAKGLRLLAPLVSGALGLSPLRRALERRSGGEPVLASEPVGGWRSRVWAEARNARGERALARVETGEGYAAAAAATVSNVEALLARKLSGAFTPASAFGASHLLTIPGVRLTDLDPESAVSMKAA